MEMKDEAAIRNKVSRRLNNVNDSMKKRRVRCVKTIIIVNRIKGPGTVLIPGTNVSYSSFSKKRYINCFRNAAIMVVAAAFMPGVFKNISMISPNRNPDMIT
jgi:hypothetical protein